MEYQTIINLLDNTPNQPSQIKTENWVEVSDDSHGTYSTSSQIKSKTSILKSILCDCSDAYIRLSGTVTVLNTTTVANPANPNNQLLINKRDGL